MVRRHGFYYPLPYIRSLCWFGIFKNTGSNRLFCKDQGRRESFLLLAPLLADPRIERGPTSKSSGHRFL